MTGDELDRAVAEAKWYGQLSARCATRTAKYAAARRARVAILVAAGWTVTQVAAALEVSRTQAQRLMQPAAAPSTSSPAPVDDATVPGTGTDAGGRNVPGDGTQRTGRGFWSMLEATR